MPDLIISYDEATQLPNRSARQRPTARLSAPIAGPPEQAVTQFIRARGDLWNLTPEDVATIDVLAVSRRGLHTVRLIQRIEGKEVFNSDVTVAISPSNEVISLAGQFFAGTGAARTLARATPEVSAEDAIAKAVFDLAAIAYEPTNFYPVDTPSDNGPYRFYQFNYRPDDTRPVFERPVRVKDVMFPFGERQFVPGYYMEIWLKGFPAFSYVVDTTGTPDVLFRKNLTA